MRLEIRGRRFPAVWNGKDRGNRVIVTFIRFFYRATGHYVICAIHLEIHVFTIIRGAPRDHGISE